MYYAVKFDEDTRRRILERAELLCPVPDDWKIYCDHVTMCHSSNKQWNQWGKFLQNHLGRRFVFRIIGYGKSDSAFALAVDLHTTNKVAHITVACAPDAKPVQSNDIEDWIYPKEYDLIEHFEGELVLCQ